MKRFKDPFPKTPESFHLRVETTLRTLEESDMKKTHVYRRTALMIAIAALLLMATALAVVTGNAGFKDRLASEGLDEVADLVQEPRLTATADSVEDFRFSVDELIWEDDDLYVSYSLSVPDDGRYMVALFTPTLNGKRLTYDGKGFHSPKFFDWEDSCATVLLMGGQYDAECSELLTFAVDPALKQNPDNRLMFRAVLLKTDLDLEASFDPTDLMDPPGYFTFSENWRGWLYDPDADYSPEFEAMMDEVADAFNDSLTLTLNDFVNTGYAEYVDDRIIDMGLDASALPEMIYNDVAEHDFDRMGAHIHIDRFRMTHLGVEIKYTVSVPGADAEDGAAIAVLNRVMAGDWRFGTADGEDLGFSLGGDGSGGWSPLEDGTPAYCLAYRENAVLPLDGLAQIIFAPCEWADDESGNHPVYDLENAIALTPVYSQAVAEIDARATPEPTLTPEEAAMLENSLSR